MFNPIRKHYTPSDCSLQIPSYDGNAALSVNVPEARTPPPWDAFVMSCRSDLGGITPTEMIKSHSPQIPLAQSSSRSKSGAPVLISSNMVQRSMMRQHQSRRRRGPSLDISRLADPLGPRHQNSAASSPNTLSPYALNRLLIAQRSSSSNGRTEAAIRQAYASMPGGGINSALRFVHLGPKRVKVHSGPFSALRSVQREGFGVWSLRLIKALTPMMIVFRSASMSGSSAATATMERLQQSPISSMTGLQKMCLLAQMSTGGKPVDIALKELKAKRAASGLSFNGSSIGISEVARGMGRLGSLNGSSSSASLSCATGGGSPLSSSPAAASAVNLLLQLSSNRAQVKFPPQA